MASGGMGGNYCYLHQTHGCICQMQQHGAQQQMYNQYNEMLRLSGMQQATRALGSSSTVSNDKKSNKLLLLLR